MSRNRKKYKRHNQLLLSLSTEELNLLNQFVINLINKTNTVVSRNQIARELILESINNKNKENK